MSDYQPITRRAYCSNDHWRATVEVIDGSNRRQVEAGVDLNPSDGTVNPRIQIADGLWVDVPQSFVSTFRALPDATAPSSEHPAICREALLQPAHPLRMTGSVETTGTVSAIGGSDQASFAVPFYANNRYGIFPNVSTTLEWRPINGVLGVFELGAGPTYYATQPAGAPYGGTPNTVPLDAPQVYLQANAGAFCAGAGRRYERLGPPVDAVRADLRLAPTVSVPFGISPYGQSVLELGVCTETVTWWNWISRGPDRHWTDNNSVPYFGSDLSLNLGLVTVAAHVQAGPDQDNNTSDWRHAEDLAVTIGAPTDTAQFTLYALVGGEQRPGSGGLWQPWGAGYGYLRIRPPGSHIGGFLRAGGNYVPPLRSGLPAAVAIGQFSGGVTVYPFGSDVFQIRTAVDVLTTFDGAPIFNGERTLPQFMLQLVVADTLNVGTPRLP